MSLTESIRACKLIRGVIATTEHQPSTGGGVPVVGPPTDWKTVATKCAIVAAFYGIFFSIKRRFFPQKRNARCNCQLISSRNICGDSRDEVCPICLESPRNGVRPGCGHRLCAGCLRRYCESFQRNDRPSLAGPPPCPLCRTPLVSVTLTYDQTNIPLSNADPETAQWLKKYNERNAGADGNVHCTGKSTFPSTALRLIGSAMLVCLKLHLASILLGIYARSYNSKVFGVDLIVYSSFLVTATGMTLLVCLWFKCQEQAHVGPNDD